MEIKSMKKQYKITDIERMYYEEKKSLPEIARYLGYTPSGIHKIMIRHNLLRRTISESKIGKTLSLEHKQNIGDSGRGLKWTEEQKRQVRGIYHWNWKGGRKKDMGYIMIYNPEHPHNHHNYIQEHRFIMEQYVGRYLNPEESVHHINFDITDNFIDNLHLFPTEAKHQKYHHFLKKSVMEVIENGS